MIRVAICYFSGTGNTKMVTEWMKRQFVNNWCEVSVFNIEDMEDECIDLSVYDLIGIGYPVYGFSSPIIVERWANRLVSDTKRVFLYQTAGDYSRFNDEASHKMVKCLNKKGYDVFYDRLIVMGSNWFEEQEHSLVRKFYTTASDKVNHMVEEVLMGVVRKKPSRRHMAYFASVTWYFLTYYGAKYFGKSLKVSSECIECGKCLKNCPVDNIHMSKNGSIKFGKKCIWCMRCIYACPTKAIDATMMKGCILKSGYDIKKIMSGGQAKETHDFKESKEHLVPYFEQIDK